MQDSTDTVKSTAWYSGNKDCSKGPITALAALESATSGWINVNNQNYTMGTTNFNGTNAYTGCDIKGNCTSNKYTLGARSARARMITVQEAKAVGCGTSLSSNKCPEWILPTSSVSYWTMSADNDTNLTGYAIYIDGTRISFTSTPVTGTKSARAVVVISK